MDFIKKPEVSAKEIAKRVKFKEYLDTYNRNKVEENKRDAKRETSQRAKYYRHMLTNRILVGYNVSKERWNEIFNK